MTPGTLHLVCPQGATFSKSLELFDSADLAISLTGYTAAMQARQTHSSKTPLFSLAVGTGLTIVDNKIYITIASATTQTFKPGEYVYDLEITDNSGKVSRLVEGKFTVTPEVTR